MYLNPYAEAEKEFIKEIESIKGFSFKKLIKIIGLSHMLSISEA